MQSGSNLPPDYPLIPPLDHILTDPNEWEHTLPLIEPLNVGAVPRIPRVSRAHVGPNIKHLNILSTGTYGRQDDTYAPVVCSWYQNIVRFATIGDGNCFLHAVLKCFDAAYQNDRGFRFRTHRAEVVRRDLAVKLAHENPEFPGRTYWETINNGQFAALTIQEVENEDLVGLYRRDYTLGGMQYMFNSFEYLGDEVYGYIADIFNIDIFVLRGRAHNLKSHVHTVRANRPRPVVAIVAVGGKDGGHYESLAIDTPEGFQTNFAPGDPFVTALLTLHGGLETLTYHPYNPDEAFLATLVATFSNNGQFVLPLAKIEEIFSEHDPFIRVLNRLMPQIRQLEASTARPQAIVEFERLRPLLTNQGWGPDSLNQIAQTIEAEAARNPQLSLSDLSAAGYLGPEIAEILAVAQIQSP
jgi:hypothetical protein